MKLVIVVRELATRAKVFNVQWYERKKSMMILAFVVDSRRDWLPLEGFRACTQNKIC